MGRQKKAWMHYPLTFILFLQNLQLIPFLLQVFQQEMSIPNRAIPPGLGNSSSLSTNNVTHSPLQWRCPFSSEKSAPWNAVLSRCGVQQKLLTSTAKHLSSPQLNHQLSHLGTNPSTINGVSKALISSHKLQITHNSLPTHGNTPSEGKNQVTSIN